MSSELQSAVSSIVENDYATLVIFTAIGYDYILTFSDEIEYIWNKPWTRVSTLFVLVRYFGLSSSIPAHQDLYPCGEFLPSWPCKGENMSIFGEWAVFLFLGVTDLAMILRVWAMYIQSRIILGILLLLYFLEIIPFLIACITMSRKFLMATAQVLDFSFCVLESGSPSFAEVNDSAQVALASMMFLLVITRFIWDSFQMYKVTRGWQPGRYMNLFAREGVLYFLAIFLFALVNVLNLSGKLPAAGWQAQLLLVLEYVPVFTLAPRFILSVRALHAREFQGGLRDIDSEFGFSSVLGRGVGAGDTRIVFAGLGQSGESGLELGEEIQLGER